MAPPPWLAWLPSSLRQPIAQKLLGNGGWLLGEKLLRAVGELTLGIWLARYLGPDQFGVLSYAIAFVKIFMPLASLGLWQIVVRDLVQTPDQHGKILGSALGLSLGGGLLTASLCLALLPWVRPQDPVVMALVAFLGVGLLCQPADLVGFWFQAQLWIKPEAIARSIAYGFASTLLGLGILYQAPLILLGVAYTIEPLCKALGLIILYRRSAPPNQPWRFHWPQAKTLLSQGWLLMISQFAIMVYMRVDQVMVAQLAGNNAAGIYAAAVKISEGWYFLLTIIYTILFPAIIRLKTIDTRAYEQQIFHLLRIVVFLSYGIMIFVLLLAPILIQRLFGIAYQEAIPVLRIHAISGIFIGVGLVRGLWLTSENYLGLHASLTTLGALLNIGFNWLLVPHSGAVGASIATLIAYGIAHYLSGFLIPCTRPITKAMTTAMLFGNHQ